MGAATPTKVLGRRVVAFWVDLALTSAVTLGVFLLLADRVPVDTNSDSAATAQVTLNNDQYLLEGGRAALFMTLAFAGWLLYTGVLPGVTGWTAGKLAAGVRLAGADGRPPGAGKGIVRALFWFADGFPYFVPGLIGFCVALASPRRQRVGDQVATTFVVRAGTVPEAQERVLAMDAPPSSASAGWYADPRGEDRLRYWDGEGWTAHTAP
jgi:uncharacterized RDD family membrane protein YckC